LKIEAEKGFRRTLFEPELVGPNLEINFVNGEEVGHNLSLSVGGGWGRFTSRLCRLNSKEREKA